jgi:hypothetical protein
LHFATEIQFSYSKLTAPLTAPLHHPPENCCRVFGHRGRAVAWSRGDVPRVLLLGWNRADVCMYIRHDAMSMIINDGTES